MMKFLAVVAVLFPLAVQAVDDRIYFVNIGNDLIGIEQTDENLSNSFSIGYQETLAKEVAQYYFDHVENANITYSLNQEIYTPEDLEAHELIEDDRPYAGWTYVKVEAANRVGNDLHIRGIEIGVVGPASGAEFLQREIHNITGSKHPEGWDNQLRNEPGINIYDRKAQIIFRRDGKWDADLVVHRGYKVGNVHTHGDVGFMARVGYNVPDDVGQNLLADGSFVPTQNAHERSFYAFFGGSARLVLRDLFLDGNTFKNSHSVEKERFVHQIKGGAVFSFRNAELGYVNTNTSPQFKLQKDSHNIGVFYLRLKRAVGGSRR